MHTTHKLELKQLIHTLIKLLRMLLVALFLLLFQSILFLMLTFALDYELDTLKEDCTAKTYFTDRDNCIKPKYVTHTE